jgi:hypothetical protein
MHSTLQYTLLSDLPDFYKPFYYVSFLKWPYSALVFNQFESGSIALELAALPSFENESAMVDVGIMMSVGLFCAVVEVL